METTVVGVELRREEVWLEESCRDDELASLGAHLNAATARFVELAWEHRESVGDGDPARYVAFRCGITVREAREYLRVAEALQGLPATRAAFARGEVTFTKVRALTRVATASSEEGLLDLAAALTASQLERALRAFRRLAASEARDTHELEYVSYHFEDDGSLVLSARLAAEDGTLLVTALDAARDRIVERRRGERARAAGDGDAGDAIPAGPFEPLRSIAVEALLELAGASLVEDDEQAVGVRLVVHVDASALSDTGEGERERCGRSELEDGPVVSPETARRLGCDAEVVAQLERDGLPLGVGRARRTVPPALRRVLEARDDRTCCFPGCERRRHLQAHHRRHWAHGGETSLDNLVLLCFHHHRLVHEGGYTIEDDASGGLRFRNRHGVVCQTLPPRPPPGSTDELVAGNERRGLEIGPHTNRNGSLDLGEFDLGLAVSAIASTAGWPANAEL